MYDQCNAIGRCGLQMVFGMPDFCWAFFKKTRENEEREGAMVLKLQ
jgi:hypothetical protein